MGFLIFVLCVQQQAFMEVDFRGVFSLVCIYSSVQEIFVDGFFWVSLFWRLGYVIRYFQYLVKQQLDKFELGVFLRDFLCVFQWWVCFFTCVSEVFRLLFFVGTFTLLMFDKICIFKEEFLERFGFFWIQFFIQCDNCFGKSIFLYVRE